MKEITVECVLITETVIDYHYNFIVTYEEDKNHPNRLLWEWIPPFELKFRVPKDKGKLFDVGKKYQLSLK